MKTESHIAFIKSALVTNVILFCLLLLCPFNEFITISCERANMHKFMNKDLTFYIVYVYCFCL